MLSALLVLAAAALAVPAGAAGEQASEPASAAAGGLDAGSAHTCALLADARVRCWGFGGDGRLGYANTSAVGDDETPGSVGPVDLGSGAVALSTGDGHACALLGAGGVRCWGFGGNGRLGYANTSSVGDDESPGSVGAVDLGAGHTAKAISAGAAHTCAVLDDDSVRCWGFSTGGSALADGRLGYPNAGDVGDNETPGSMGPVQLGTGRTAVAISAGGAQTCALLDGGDVRCFGRNDSGQLGYGNTRYIGDNETPDAAGPVNLGPGRTAKAISAGAAHTCALLDDGSVRCWGEGGHGRLGYGSSTNIGDSETPDSVGPVNLGPGRTARAVSAGDAHTCALLDNGSVRCWGLGASGALGYGNQANVGDNETPDSAGPVDLGSGRTAVAIGAGKNHTCVRLDDGSVRCWGYGANGRLGYCNQNSIGDNETPGSAGPVDLGGGGAGCAGPGGPGSVPGSSASATVPGSGGGQSGGVDSVDPALGADARRARALRRCLARVGHKARRYKERARRACLRRYGRTPGRVAGLQARAVSGTEIVLSFAAPGTDGPRPPAARNYLVKQSGRPIRGARGFARARTLCHGSCRFSPTRIGETITLTITDLQPHTTYYYAVAARDNVSHRLGPRSASVSVRTP